MAKISNRQYAKALYEITLEASDKDLDEILFAFAKLLVRNHKLKQADNIIDEYIKYQKEMTGMVEIQIESARVLDSSVVENIKSIFGKSVEAVTSVDKDLIGGIRVKVGDKIMDASLRAQLKKLKQQFS